MFKRPPKGTSDSGQSGASYDFGSWAKPCPALCEFLTQTRWEDGTVRATGTFLMLAEDGVWKGSLHDRDAQRSCWLSGKTPTDLLSAVEKVCLTGEADWRAKPVLTPQKGRRG